MNEALAWWWIKFIVLPLCVFMVLMTLVDAVIDLWRGPKP